MANYCRAVTKSLRGTSTILNRQNFPTCASRRFTAVATPTTGGALPPPHPPINPPNEQFLNPVASIVVTFPWIRLCQNAGIEPWTDNSDFGIGNQTL
jgi:hypothetical protein